MWVFRLIMGQAFSKDGKFLGIRRGYEAPKLKVDEIYGANSDEEMIRKRRDGMAEKKERRLFLPELFFNGLWNIWVMGTTK